VLSEQRGQRHDAADPLRQPASGQRPASLVLDL